MGKNKLAKFAEMDSFPHVVQMTAREIQANSHVERKGTWNARFFKNNNPIVLELGCGKGEYTVELARMFPATNFIGVDIKGARMWTGAKESYEAGLKNVGFLRTNIEMIHHFFGPNEVSEIWLTFPDPQMKKVNKRLTSTNFMCLYQQFLKDKGVIHLKTDSNFMFTYTREMVKKNAYKMLNCTDDLYASSIQGPLLQVKTYYEQQWLERGISIKYLQFLLNHKTTFVEPDIEIEYDSYRSFGRSKRHLVE